MNELEKEKFEINFDYIINYKDNRISRPTISKYVKEKTALSSSTFATSGEENPLSKFNSLKYEIFLF